jgi:large subunit ribosomal protein L17
MSSHRRLVKHFSRKSGPLKALIRGLMVSLVEHGRIKTTEARAKEVRRHIERVVTLGKKGRSVAESCSTALRKCTFSN